MNGREWGGGGGGGKLCGILKTKKKVIEGKKGTEIN